MGFSDIVLFQLNMVNQSMQKEINSYFKEVKKEKMKYDKSAMSKARQKISPSLYEDKKSVKLYHGLRILGIDGTNIELPNMGILKDKKQTEDIQNIYGR